MYHSRLAAAGCAFTLLAAAPAAAQTPAAEADVRARSAAPEHKLKAVSRLFAVPEPVAGAAQPWTPPALAAPNSARRFICRMPVLPADPRLDRSFEVPLPKGATKFSMRIVTPVCQ